MEPAASKKLFGVEVRAMRKLARFKTSWPIISATYPDLVVELPHPSGAKRRFRFRCDNWDEQPPSVKSVDAEGNVLDGQPTGGLFMQLNGGYGLCAPGTREYHRHHGENPWANHQESTSLADIIARVAAFYRKANP